MAQVIEQRKLRCYFGILNLAGLMDTDDKVSITGDLDYSEVKCPVFSTEAYTIKTTFNRNLFFNEIREDGYHKSSQHFAKMHFLDKTDQLNKEYQGSYYQKRFRREVLWDFGDGTQKMGYSAEHSYKLPGRYRITCTFFDINRRAWTNLYHVDVIVKEVLPNIIRFDDSIYPQTLVKKEVRCSKIERLARLQALNSNIVKEELPIHVERIFSEEEYKTNYKEIKGHYTDLSKVTFKHMNPYWTFLENTQTLFYNSDKVHSTYLTPTSEFSPRYVNLYVKFYHAPAENESEKGKIGIALYQVIPYKNIDENLKTIKILDPNNFILDYNEEKWIEVQIVQLYADSQIPQDVVYIGRRGFCDVFYKNDFVGHDNVFRFIYNPSTNFTNDIISSVSYTNLIPIGMSTKVIGNDLDNVRIGYTTDGFLRDLDEVVLDKTYHFDPHLYNSLYKGIDLDVYLFPFITYDEQFYIEGADDLVIDIYQGGIQTTQKMYYVPKDLTLSLKCIPNKEKGKGNSSYVNHGFPDDYENGDDIAKKYTDYIIGVQPWFYRVPLVLQDYINIDFEVLYYNNNKSNVLRSIASLVKHNLKSSNDIYIPRQRQSREDVQKLLKVYMGHPMFDETDNLRDAMRAYLGGRNGLLQNMLTATDNFIDDTANIKTCYLKNLISTLQMMGEDVTQFEQGSFDGVNDVKNFVRLLSMNHTDLVGHKIKEQYDIKVADDAKGKHVGDEIDVEDVLSLNQEEGNYLGRIIGIKKKGFDKVSATVDDNGYDLIVSDRYTKTSRIVKLYGLQKNNMTNEGTYKSSISIAQYDDSWGWNLLLPVSFEKINKKISENLLKANNGAYSLQRRQEFLAEVERLKKMKSDLIKGYYRFFLLKSDRKDRRIGNFIPDAYISERIEDTEEWDARWGVTHEILMKILLDNCFLKNGRKIGGAYDDAQGEIEKPEYIPNGTIEEIKNIRAVPKVVYVNNFIEDDIMVTGSIRVTGEITGAGRNILVISMLDCIVDDYSLVQLNPTQLQVRVNYDGTIVKNTETYVATMNNCNIELNVTVSGRVEEPEFDYNMIVNLVDERMEKYVVFKRSQNIKTYVRNCFYSNLNRQLRDNSLFEAGYNDNLTKTEDLIVSLSFNQKSKLGNNLCTLSASYSIGQLVKQVTGGLMYSSVETDNIISAKDIVNVIIDYNGEIHFANEYHEVPVTYTNENGYTKGKLYFKLRGNAVLGTHELLCYTYDPRTNDNGIQLILATIGGYSLNINHNMQGSRFLVNGEDGFEQGYRLVIDSIGLNTMKIGEHQTDADVTMTLYNEKNEVVDVRRLQNHHIAKVDGDCYLTESAFMLKETRQQNNVLINGSIGINCYGGYYDLSGFDIQITIK